MPDEQLPAIVVIDSDPTIVSVVRSALPEWEVYHAYDEVVGMAFVRAQRSRLALAVLDVQMPHDGVLVAVQIRSEAPNLPLVAFTSTIESVPLLTTLGCTFLPKPAPGAMIAAHLREAIERLPPPLPTTPFLSYLQRRAVESEHAALLRERAALPVAILASSELLQSGLHGMVAIGGAATRLTTTSVAVLRHRLASAHVALLVADASVCEAAATVAREHGLPLLVVALTLSAGYRVIDRAQGVVVDPVAPTTMAAALAALATGQCYRDSALDRAFASTPLTRTEQEILKCLLRGLRPNDIAAELHMRSDTVYRHQSNIYAKWEVADLEELRAKLDVQRN